eukprot:NODE_13531_length_1160_cov_5.436592.p1 GENE.NODE_13531_length_1160_cov_5.436592~~NODE_13531_length_1160_cov_5.436592.p1  ORF type:complete len:250 (-),score=54.96 NODE_13531_length_1160_cov_5.436592:230-979(-)
MSARTSRLLGAFSGGTMSLGTGKARMQSDDDGLPGRFSLLRFSSVNSDPGAYEPSRHVCNVCGMRLGKRVFNPRHQCGSCNHMVCGGCSQSTVVLEDQKLRACAICVQPMDGSLKQRAADVASELHRLAHGAGNAALGEPRDLLEVVSLCEEALASLEALDDERAVKRAAHDAAVASALESHRRAIADVEAEQVLEWQEQRRLRAMAQQALEELADFSMTDAAASRAASDATPQDARETEPHRRKCVVQ